MDRIAYHFLAKMYCFAGFCIKNLKNFFRGLYPRKPASAPCSWTLAPISAWFASVPIVPVLRNDHCPNYWVVSAALTWSAKRTASLPLFSTWNPIAESHRIIRPLVAVHFSTAGLNWKCIPETEFFLATFLWRRTYVGCRCTALEIVGRVVVESAGSALLHGELNSQWAIDSSRGAVGGRARAHRLPRTGQPAAGAAALFRPRPVRLRCCRRVLMAMVCHGSASRRRYIQLSLDPDGRLALRLVPYSSIYKFGRREQRRFGRVPQSAVNMSMRGCY